MHTQELSYPLTSLRVCIFEKLGSEREQSVLGEPAKATDHFPCSHTTDGSVLPLSFLCTHVHLETKWRPHVCDQRIHSILLFQACLAQGQPADLLGLLDEATSIVGRESLGYRLRERVCETPPQALLPSKQTQAHACTKLRAVVLGEGAPPVSSLFCL